MCHRSIDESLSRGAGPWIGSVRAARAGASRRDASVCDAELFASAVRAFFAALNDLGHGNAAEERAAGPAFENSPPKTGPLQRGPSSAL